MASANGPARQRADDRRQLPALVSDPRHRHLDPPRRPSGSSALYWISGGAPNPTTHQTNAGATGQSATIPLNSTPAARNRADNLFYMSPQQSKLSVETRTPTAWGEARTFIEFDFANHAGAKSRRHGNSRFPTTSRSVSVTPTARSVLCSSARRIRISPIPTRVLRPSRSPVWSAIRVTRASRKFGGRSR